MKHKKLSYDLLPQGLCAQPPADQPDSRYEAMRRALHLAIQQELTPRQRFCIEHRLSGEKVQDIAAELGLAPSTVSMHLKRASRRLRHTLQYSRQFLETR
ncbi:MAG: LuxR C-terminal-related transcriptional regulator [Oscillospiraceae bacterium]|jgi:RNA polymerase sigma factor (sigma-70 family)|nr:LuxR C-terminal-related transcriptional regulator [Oscillospiraceae bacterium]MDD3261119.1 sigma factor-like helix-turn-helix DNA-binding protein [Oscillospiraceae bacterium]